MLTNKLLAALGIAGALLIGATADASANPWRGGAGFRGAGFRGPVYRAPVYRAPVYRAPVYGAPVYGQAYAPYPTSVYAPGGLGWRHHGWMRPLGRRW